MNKRFQQGLILLALMGGIQEGAAQGTAFTYQGQLAVSGTPVPNGWYDFQFQVIDTTGNSYGMPNPNSFSAVGVTNGLFTVTLDFGANVFTGPARLLQIFARTNGTGTFASLSPPQALTPTPYAIFAGGAVSANTVANAGVSSLQLNTPSAPTSGQVLGFNGTSLFWTSLNSAGLTLPYSGGASSSGSLFTLTNLGTGPAAVFLGNVGIGTTSPGGTLSLFNSASDTILKLEDRRADSSSSFLSKQSFYDYYSEGAYVGLRHNGGLSPTVRALVFGLSAANSGSASEVMRITTDGNVGIGTTAPHSTLDVNGYITATGGVFDGTAGNVLTGPASILSVSNGSAIGYGISAGGQNAIQAISKSGNAAYIATSLYDLDAIGSQSVIRLNSSQDPNGSVLELKNTTVGASLLGAINFNDYTNGFPGQIAYAVDTGLIFRVGGVNRMSILQDGTVSVPVLEITGGSDLAEPFQMSSAEIPKGSLVIIDDVIPGHLKVSNQAYDTHVAGIVSGANGINPGISLHQDGALGCGQNVALSGRVYALADTVNGAIHPGDLLTTSSTPGHCMKVTDHARGQGAIIGKAMSSLESGRGTVLVLVSLQ